MTKTKLSAEERKQLQAYNKTSPLVLIRYKCQAVLMHDEAVSYAAIAQVIGRSKRVIERWLSDWNNRRLASLFTGHQDNGNAAKLTKAQLAEIQATLTSPPSDTGLSGAFWDVPKLKSYLEASFGVVYESESSYHFLLRFSNLSFKYPSAFDRKRDLGLIGARMREIQLEIAPLLIDPSWEVFAVDEVRMEQEALTRRAWLRKGERTVIKADRDKQAQSYIGFLNQTTFQCAVYEMPWQNRTKC